MNNADAQHRILIAESGAFGCPAAGEILTEAGFAVDAVADGLLAVEAAGARGYALILVDLDVPGLDGLEVARRIRRLPRPRGEVPILALSAGSLAEDQDRCIVAGVDGFLAKPVGRAQLLAAVAHWAKASPAPVGLEPEAGAVLPLLNRGTLAQLEEDVGSECLPDILATFLTETERRVDRLAVQVAAGDAAGAADEAHALKGSSATFGALALRQAAFEMEQAGRAEDWERIAQVLTELQRRSNATCELMRAHYPLLAP